MKKIIFLLLFILIGTCNLAMSASNNLCLNPDFEEGEKWVDGWSTRASSPQGVEFELDSEVVYSGKRSVKISASTPNDARFLQRVAVKPYSFYQLSGWIKTSDVADTAKSDNVGANLSIEGSNIHTYGLTGTNDWTYVSLVFSTKDRNEVTIAARLGFNSGETTGTAWFDQIKLEYLTSVEEVLNSGPARSIPEWNLLVIIVEKLDVRLRFKNENYHIKKQSGNMSSP